MYDTEEGTGEAWVASNLPGEGGTSVNGIPLARLVPGPLPLVKLLDSTRHLSVQLHPDDDLARELHGPGHRGKWETWYFLRPPAEGHVFMGLADEVEPSDLLEHVRAGKNPEDLLRAVQVEAGDSVAIPPGTVHALTQGAVVAEVQTPADLTYRIYDWGRVGLDGQPRELHLSQSERALQGPVSNPDAQPPAPVPGSAGRYRLATCGPVGFELLRAHEGPVSIGEATSRHALVLLGLADHVELRSRGGTWEPERIERGECVVLPPGSGDLLVGGPGEAALGYLTA
jgi:mannose-6-phosphate isomerase